MSAEKIQVKDKPLEKMTVKDLKEIAKEIPEISGVHGMKKDELIVAIKEVKGIQDLHDLHVWTIGSGYHAASAHLLVANMDTKESGVLIEKVTELLKERYSITHTTLQVEDATAPAKDGSPC